MTLKMRDFKGLVHRTPVVGRIARNIYLTFYKFPGSESYWDRRYSSGGNSGAGSYGKFSALKARTLNAFVEENGVSSVIEYGCGDGNQLRTAEYPQYLGFDVSPVAIAMCRKIFAQDATKSFRLMSEYAGETARLALSLDVIYHLVEDEVFESYMHRLFASATRYVIIYSSDTEDPADNGPFPALLRQQAAFEAFDPFQRGL